MILKGIVESSFGGRTLFRGFATLKNLARVSISTLYQREVEPSRVEEIKTFLIDGSFRFFPELLFGMRLPDNQAINHIYQTLQGSINLSNGIKIGKAKFRIDNSRLGENPTTKVMSLTIPEKLGPILYRIDGNHRLNAVDEILNLSDGTPDTLFLQQTVGNIIVPFSILLQEDSGEARKYEAAFYYLINAHAKPLTDNQNLKAILHEDYFTSEERKKIIGNFAETLENVLPYLAHYSSIKPVYENEEYGFLYTFFSLFSEDKYPSKEAVISALNYTNHQYYGNTVLCGCLNPNILLVLLYYQLTDEKCCLNFIKWATENSILSLSEVAPGNIISIFDKIYSSELSIFVAMPYFDNDAEIIKDYNSIYSENIQSIAEEYGITLKLFPIMSNKGATQDQIQDIVNKIQNCTILFADITGNNPNVSYEMGWARALKKHVVIVKRKGSDEPKSDYKNDTYHEYNDKARKISLGKIIRENIVEILIKNYGVCKI